MVSPESDVQRQALEEIRRILGEELAVAAAVEPGQALMADLHLDSMELLTLAVGLENRFRVKLNESDGAAVKTVGNLAALVAQRVSEKAA